MSPFLDTLRMNVMQAEGFRPYAYRDSKGLLTIGYGRMIDQSAGGHITQDEALYLLDNDLKVAAREAATLFSGFDSFSENRQAALAEMSFNLGTTKLAGFTQMRAAIERGDWEGAAKEAADSTWHRQVGQRAIRIENMLRSG